MPDIASLQFNIDSSQAQRAIAVLDTLKATSISVVGSTNQQNAAQGQLTTGYAQQRDALVRLADQTKAYDGTLTGLIKNLDDVRGKVEIGRGGFVNYTTTLNQATQAAVQFNSTVEGLDRYVAKTRELNIVIRDTSTGFANIISAQQNLTVQGNAARAALEQLGVSLKGISPTDPGAVLQQLSERLRGFRESQGTLAAAQTILGPSFDAQALQRLQRQPYVPFRVAEQTQITTSAAAAVDTTRAGSQRQADQTARAEAERRDLGDRFTQDPTLTGRLGLNLSGGTGRAINQTRDEELRRLREIAAMSPEERRRYTGIGTQITDAFRGTPGSQDQGTIGWLGRTFRRATDGTYSANQENIEARYQEERRTQGLIPAFLNAQGRGIANLPGLNAYDPYVPPTPPKTAAELLSERQASGQILSQFGDTSLAQVTEAQRQYTEFTAGDRIQNFNLTSPGTANTAGPSHLPASAGGYDVGPGPRQEAQLGTQFATATGAIRQRYIDQYGEAGNLRYENREATLALGQRYAGAPEQQTRDETAREDAIRALAPEERVRARTQLQFLAQTAGAGAARIEPGERPTLDQLVSSNRLTSGQRTIANDSFQSGVRGQLQQGTEETERQIQLQARLTEALKDGRAAAEDVTRAYGAYVSARVQLGASDPEASKSAVEAITLLQRQRTTQATAQTEQIKQQNDLSREKLDQAKQIQQLDPITKSIMARDLDVEQQLRTEQQNGTLPNAAGGQYRKPDGTVVQIPAAADAQRVIGERRTALREQQDLGAGNAIAQGSNENQRQIDLQDKITAALRDGKAAAEDVTRAYGVYVDARAKLGASDPDATKAGVEAINLLQRQRTTEATAQTEQIKQQNDLARAKLENAKQIQQLDPITKIIMSGQFDIEQQLTTEQRNGTLPNAGGGQYRKPDGTLVSVAAGADTQRVIEERRQALLDQQRQAAGGAAQASSEGVRQTLDDQRELLSIMEHQNVTIEQANRQLAIQKQYRDAIAVATRDGDKAEVARLQGEEKKTQSDQGAADRAGQRIQITTTGQAAARGTELTGVTSGGTPGDQALRAKLAPTLQLYTQPGGILAGQTLEEAYKRSIAGTLPDETAQAAVNQIVLEHDQGLTAAQTLGTTQLGAETTAQRQRNNVLLAPGGSPAAAARVPIPRQTTENRQGQQEYEANQQRQRVISQQESEAAGQSFTARTSTVEARARSEAARLPVSQAAGAGAALGIQQQVAAGTRQFDPEGLSVAQRTYETLNEAIAKYSEETDKANLATRTQIQDQAASNEAIKNGEAAYRAAAIDAQAAGEIRIAEGLKSIATTREEIAALDEWIARIRQGSTEQKQLARDQAAGNLSRQSRSQDESTAVVNAQTDRGIFASDRDLRRTGEQTRLDQQIKDQGLEGTPQAREAQTSLAGSQAARDNAEQMNNLREAARGAGNAVESAFSAIVIHGERGRAAALSLVEALGDVILKAAVFKPLENLISTSLSGSTPSASGAVSGGFWSGIGAFLGGGSAAAGGAAAAGAASNSALLAGSVGLYAAGGVFDQGGGESSIHAYSNQVIRQPTMFRFAAGGNLGQMGEGGSPEAVMPLSRDASGRLGILGGGGSNITIHTPITVNAAPGGGGGGVDPATMKMLQRQLDQTVRQSVRGVMTDEKRPGGALY